MLFQLEIDQLFEQLHHREQVHKFLNMESGPNIRRVVKLTEIKIECVVNSPILNAILQEHTPYPFQNWREEPHTVREHSRIGKSISVQRVERIGKTSDSQE